MSLFERVVRRLPKSVRPLAQEAKLRLVGGETLVPEDELEGVYRKALQLLRERHGRVGDYLEFGVYRGSSMACMYRAAEAVGATEMRLFGFDSFEGLPDAAEHDDGGLVWWPRQFAASRQLAERTLRKHGVERAVLIGGWFDDTLNEATRREHEIEEASVVMIDCDMYLSAKRALEFCAPLIKEDAVIVFDDWHSAGLAEEGLGEKRAFEELLAEHPELSVAAELDPYSEAARVFLVRRAPDADPGS